MSEFSITRLGHADHELVQSRIDTAARVWEHDRVPLPSPTPARIMAQLAQHRRDKVIEQWVAVQDGRAVGFAPVHLQMLDNTHNLQFDIGVHPDFRGRGVGSALLDHIEARAAELGRTNLSALVHSPVPEGPQFLDHGSAFLERRGYANALTMNLSVVDLDEVDDTRIERLWTEAWKKAEGFELVLFEGMPEEPLLEGIGYLHGRVFADSPTGDWDVREVVFDAERVRDNERLHREAGLLHLHAAVVHTETGALAGYTEVLTAAGHEHTAQQGDTIVDPRFRGHRLGTILKIANQRRIRDWRPKVRHVWTGNAADNHRMIAVNESIGYRRGAVGLMFQKTLA